MVISTIQVLDEPGWRARAAAHRARVECWTGPHRARRRRHESHPVLDFLFTYYSLRPRELERWRPGPGIALRGGAAFGSVPGHVADGDVVRLDPAALPDRVLTTAAFVRSLLTATAARPPRLNCFGLHEWAMVYRSDAPRHRGVPLRLGAAGTDEVLESLPVHCTHHDAFRFFTDAARPRNALVPTRADQVAHEQPGCLHATMDLYKWAYKLDPATPVGAARRLLRAGGGRCASWTCGPAPTTCPSSATRRCGSRPRPGGPSTPAPRPIPPPEPPRCGGG